MVNIATLDAFEDQLTHLLPKMRGWALGFTRNASAADDLVQDVAAKALANKETFIPGTNFKAWVHRIMVNHFISSVRARREYVSVDEVPEIPIAAEQHGKVDLDQLSAEFDRLPGHLRETLRQIAVEERSYEDVSRASGCAAASPGSP